MGSSRFYLSLEDDLMRIFAGEWVKNILIFVPILAAQQFGGLDVLQAAIAFLFFLDEQVDIAVLEVGLGGRLDSTGTGIMLRLFVSAVAARTT